MSIHPRDILFYGGGAALQKYGRLSRCTAPIGRNGEDVIETFTRTGTAAYVSRDGNAYLAAANTPRIHWIDSDDDGVLDMPLLMIEDAATNLCTYSDEISNWTSTGSPTTSDAAVSLGELDLCLLGDDDGAATEYKRLTVSYTGDAVKGVCVYVKAGTSAPGKSSIGLYDTTGGASRLLMDVTFSSGVPVVTEDTGSHLATTLLSNGVYRLDFQTTAVTAANTNELRIRPANDGDADTGNIYVGGVQTENNPYCTSRIVTSGGTATRNAEALTFPFWAPPQATTLYVKIVELQEPNFDDDDLVCWSDASLTTSYLRLRKLTATDSYRLTHGGAGLNSDLDINPSYADEVELRATLGADGGVQLHGALNGGTESSGVASATDELPSAWSDTVMHVGGRGASNVTHTGFYAIIVARGSQSLADFRALLP